MRPRFASLLFGTSTPSWVALALLGAATSTMACGGRTPFEIGPAAEDGGSGGGGGAGTGSPTGAGGQGGTSAVGVTTGVTTTGVGVSVTTGVTTSGVGGGVTTGVTTGVGGSGTSSAVTTVTTGVGPGGSGPGSSTGSGNPTGCIICAATECPEALDCIQDPVCASGVACTVVQCLGGGTPDPACVVGCFDGDLGAAFDAIQVLTCVATSCGSECLGLLPGGGVSPSGGFGI